MLPPELSVELADRSYPITFHAEPAEALKSLLQALHGRRCFVLCDGKVWQSQPRLAQIASTCPYFIMEPGEASKSLRMLGEVLEAMAQARVDRAGVLIALGGGVVGDLGGYAAASYLRGIEFIQFPTTLLAMVDSSVGGKTGINLAAGKNLAGAFWQPSAVRICPEVLETLPPREFSAGMAEVVKYGLLGDRGFFGLLESFIEPLCPGHPSLASVIRHCCQMKAEVVRADETETAETGGRALLNLGHTFAHAIENVAGYGTYLHGEAVSIGMVMAMEASMRVPGFNCALKPDTLRRAKALLSRYGLPLDLKSKAQGGLDTGQLMLAMQKDKKNRLGKLRLVLMRDIGETVTFEGVPEAQVQDLWQRFGSR